MSYGVGNTAPGLGQGQTRGGNKIKNLWQQENQRAQTEHLCMREEYLSLSQNKSMLFYLFCLI
jgi:hypothetical protein